MGKDKYKVIDKSATAHCCFSHSVVENNEDEFPDAICECMIEEDATRICNALNKEEE